MMGAMCECKMDNLKLKLNLVLDARCRLLLDLADVLFGA